MSIQEYILAGSKLPVHNHYQLRLKRLESQQPGVDISVLRFSGSEAISDILRYEIAFTRTGKDAHRCRVWAIALCSRVTTW
ncbi:hypothetical protein [Rahnella aceris]|uniref:hypothetical protein n=1 Tax=Rahnella sp. (strain Y9602) TaxID=2703885 RepID=UPI000E653835|nr:hypothetical protein [Rahnella aceris]AYA09707.1 hypothetical protein D3Z09_24470 [Rahnella aquatilis]QEU49733.1 hypothetical protein EJP80_24675 [Rahnella aquatilis]UNK55845.1 hypothetical protein MNO10_22485 [Rahnella aceris]